MTQTMHGRAAERQLHLDRRTRVLALILTAAVAVMAAWAPAARADWSAPVTVSAPHDAISDLQLASGPTAELLAWKYWDLVLPAKQIFGPHGARDAVATAPGWSFGPERKLPNSYASGPLVNLGGGRVAQLILTPSRLNTSVPSVAIGRVNGTFGAPLPIRGSVFANRVSLAGNPRGDLLVSWIAADGHGGHRAVWTSVRLAGGCFGAPQVLSSHTNPDQVRAAIGPRRGMVVAFDSGRGQLLARVRRARGAWGPIQRLGPAAVGTENDVTPYAGNTGGIVVAWYHTQLCEGGCISPGYIDVAVQTPGMNRFHPAQVLERDPIGAAGAPSGRSLAPALVAVRREVMIAFLSTEPTTIGAAPTAVKVAYLLGTRFTAPETISPTDEQLSNVSAAAGSSGQMVTWIRADPPSYAGGGTVFAAVRLPNTGRFPHFTPPEQVSPSEHVSSALATFNVASHWPANSISPWTVAWISRSGEPTTGAQAKVRVSTPVCPIPRSLPPPPSLPLPDPACSGPN